MYLTFYDPHLCSKYHTRLLVKSCDVVDICAQDFKYAQSPTNSPTSSRVSPLCDNAADHWHPTEDKSKCSNSRDYPELWDHASLRKVYLHNTADACCEMFFFSWGKVRLSLNGRVRTYCISCLCLDSPN